MLKEKKKLLITIALLIIAIFGVSVAAYTLAGSGVGQSEKISTDVQNREAKLDGNLGYMEYVSNIDLIIEDSNNEANYKYNIVHIVPSNMTGTHAIEQYAVADANFKKLVIDANSDRKTAEMAPNTVQVTDLMLNANMKLDTEVSAGQSIGNLLGNADLIYMEAPSETTYTGSYAIDDDIYSYIKNNYAMTDHKPIIIDKPKKSGDVVVTTKTYRALINEISERYLYSPVFGWEQSLTAEQFLAGSGSSHFFSKVISEKASGKILVLQGPGEIGAGNTMAEKFAKKELMDSIYYGKSSLYPDDFTLDYKDITTLTAADLQGYEFIFIENSAVKVEVTTPQTEEIYNALKEMADLTQYIIYDTVNIDPKNNSGDNGGNKYLELYNTFVTSDGLSKYPYVLPVDNGFFAKDALKTEGAKLIADLINGSNYRGSESNGRGGKKFRVLELQPCYPIDLDIASKKESMKGACLATSMGLTGNYYTDPGGVLKNTSVDEAGGAEYYAFEVTKAKIAKATGLSYNQIQIDQMSTDEFISSKDVVLDTYDLVYIGGNTSALTPYTLRSDFAGNYTSLSNYIAYNQSKFVSSFDMYTHTGIASHLQGYPSSSNTGVGGNPYGTIKNSENLVTDVLLNGNDITSIKLQELKDYIDAGMPILFSDAVSQAYMQVYDKTRLQKLTSKEIDPDSNMYKLLDYAYFKYNPTEYKGVDSTVSAAKDGSAATMSAVANIKWNLDISSYDKKDDYNSNKDKRYGAKAGDYVTVFNQTTADEIKNVIQVSATRPSLIINSAPKDYSRGDESTYNKKVDNKMIIKAQVNANTLAGNTVCKLILYVDENGNGTFEDNEIVDGGAGKEKLVTCQQAANGASELTELTYNFPQDDFYGLVSWKLVASLYTEGSTNAQTCDVKKGYAYYVREDNVEKKEIRTLQIMPVNTVTQDGFTVGTQDAHTLYMCTECQLASYKAKYNIMSEAAGVFHTNTTGTKKSHAKIDNIGLHEHKFGIVKYDSNGQKIDDHDKNGADDWNSNFADELKEDYDFDLDIMLIDEFHEVSKIVEANTGADGKETTMDNANGVERVDEDGQPIQPIHDADNNTITWVAYYQAKADGYYDQWQKALGKMQKSSCISNMVQFLQNLQTQVGTAGKQGNIGVVTADEIQQWIDHEAYYNYFMYYSGYYNMDANYLSYYNEWVTLHDDVVKYHNLYKKYSCYSGTIDNWIGSNYDMVVLGFAEDFGGKDLTVQECNAVKQYVADGGSLLATHDSTTRYESTGSVNLTTQLRDVFGIDRFHATLDSINSSTPTVTDRTYNLIYVRDKKTNICYGPITLTNKNVTVNLVKEDPSLVEPFPDAKTNASGNSYTIYKPYSIVEGGTVTPGDGFEMTFNLYDTIEDAKNDKKSHWGYTDDGSWALCQLQTQSIQEIDQLPIDSSGTKVYKGTKDEVKLMPSSSTVVRYPVYKYADPKYFMTQKSIIGDSPEDLVVWQTSAIKNSNVGNGGSLFGIISLVGTTDSVGIYETASHLSSPYKYVEFNLTDTLHYAIGVDYGDENIGGTDRATQINKGITTTYPFTLGDDIKISPTHAQTYATDLEDSNMAVWYALAGSSRKTTMSAKSISSLYAASPNDGMDNYFIYTYLYGNGKVNYCGAGHSVVTGAGKNNNDERMLYVNLVVDSVRNSASKPKVIVKDTDNKEITEDSDGKMRLDEDGNVVYKLDNGTDYPEFNFDVKFSSLSGGLSEVLVFYDLNYDSINPEGDYSNRYTEDANHVLIHQYSGPFNADNADEKVKIEENKINVKLRKGMYQFLDSDGKSYGDTLGLNEKKDKDGHKIDYFANYGNYTYIVIWAKDVQGKTAFARIKIKLQQTLFDLTYNTTIAVPKNYNVINKLNIDMTNRVKYNI